jgi:hypothetical protein
LAIFATAVLPAHHSSIEAVAVLLLAVGFAALAAFALTPSPRPQLPPQTQQLLAVPSLVGTVLALAVLAAEELVREALAVQFQAFCFPALALRPLGWGLGGMDTDEGVVHQQVLELTVLAYFEGIELPHFDDAGFEFFIGLAARRRLFGLWLDCDDGAVGGDLEFYLLAVGG